MPRRNVLVSQHARLPALACILSGAAAAGLIRPFVGAYDTPLLGLVVLTAIFAVFLHVFHGVRSWVVGQPEDPGSLVLFLRPQRNRVASEVRADWMSRLTPCTYEHRWNQQVPTPDGADPEYHHTFRQIGYRGPGLTVVYRIPPRFGGDEHVRTWTFPAPKAEAFIAALQQHR